jgi:hypothetical protein
MRLAVQHVAGLLEPDIRFSSLATERQHGRTFGLQLARPLSKRELSAHNQVDEMGNGWTHVHFPVHPGVIVRL